MIKRYFELQEKVLSYNKDANTELLKKAYSVAADAHIGQKRATDEPYIIHPLAVAATLAEMRLDEISIAAGLLHDIVEDTSYTIEKIEDLFGKEIADIVWGITKISKIPDYDADDAKAETLKKMIIAMTNDIRVILIKLADRLHNIRTLEFLPVEKRKRISLETLEIYAPIAFRLGMGKVKDELEDVSFMYAYPKEYERINKEVSEKKGWADKNIENVKKEIEKILKKYKIKGKIFSRIKREYSIYKKLLKQEISLDKVFDLLALRVVTDTVENCYVIMGEIHHRWQHIPGRWRDLITNPKSNGYQSIHTTIITMEGVILEIQIRTEEMHRVAEEGIAAHWRYKEGISFIENDQRLQWFREMIEAHKTNPDPKEFLLHVKGDLTPDEIYVFTPKGKVINLKAGSTPIDFAYAIHTEIGNQCKGAIVNENLVPLRTKLNSGDMVEVLTAKNITPSSDWLKFVATSKARKKIMSYIQKKENLIHVERGKKIWARVLRDYKKRHALKLDEDDLMERIAKIHYTDIEVFFRDIGSGKKNLDRSTLKALFPEVSASDIKIVKRPQKKASQAYKLINVEGYNDIDVTLAKCCSPVKGEKITGYITTNRGLVVHRQNCVNLKNVVPDRLKNVSWNEVENYFYSVKYDLIIQDKPGVLSAISSVPAEYNSNIKNVGIEKISQSLSKIKLTLEIEDINQLNQIYRGLKKLKDVFSVVRKRVSEKV